MSFFVSRKNPSLAFRLTAMLAALLIVALSIFAVSPGLHAWLHRHEKSGAAAVIAAGSPAAANHAAPEKAAHDHEDGCAVVLFAAGVLAVCGALLAWLFVRRVCVAMAQPSLGIVVRVLRYRLPPLCGPPLS